MKQSLSLGGSCPLDLPVGNVTRAIQAKTGEEVTIKVVDGQCHVSGYVAERHISFIRACLEKSGVILSVQEF